MAQLSSFGSQSMGVVNVQADKTAVLGVFRGNQRKMQSLLSPFLHTLSYYVMWLHFRPHGAGQTTAKAGSSN